MKLKNKLNPKTKKMKNKKELMVIGMLLVVLISVNGVLGDTNTWTVSSLSTFDTASSWNTGSVSVATNEVTFLSDNNIDPQIYIGGIKIYITDAQHLDENHTFIENVYNETKTQDEVYTDYIPINDYIRIWFPQNLTNKNTIIIIAESEGTADVEVYGKNGTELLGVFENIVPGKAKYETGVSELTDTFDLKVVGDSVRFDYIVDPATVWIPPGVNLLNNSYGSFEKQVI